MKTNWLITLGVGLISAGIGFIVGSKWTEKEIKERNEDFYQKEYNLLKETWEKRKEEEIRADERQKCQEMAAEAEKMHEGMRKSDERGRVEWEFEENDECVDENPDKMATQKRRMTPKERAEMDFEEEIDQSERVDLPGNPNAKRDPRFPYLITYDEYYASEMEEHHMTWDMDNEMLIDDEDPERVPDIDSEVSFEALEVLNEGRENIIFVRNEKLGCEFVIERLDPRG